MIDIKVIKLMRAILGWCGILVVMLGHAENSEIPDFFEQQVLESDTINDNSMTEVEQQHHIDDYYVGEDQTIQKKKFFNNQIFHTDHLRIYNHTEYALDGVENKYSSAQLRQVNLNDLSISLGYTIEWWLNAQQRIGYEYLSSFPYDRGQSVSLFWKVQF